MTAASAITKKESMIGSHEENFNSSCNYNNLLAIFIQALLEKAKWHRILNAPYMNQKATI